MNSLGPPDPVDVQPQVEHSRTQPASGIPYPRVLPKGGAVARHESHTDLHAADGDRPVKPTLPFVPGHERVGFVAALGKGVKGIKEGNRDGVRWLRTA